jgi:glycosyltransferase involved in cell wall biosynthesis
MSKSICFIIPELIFRETGGAELQVTIAANELLLRGWNVEIITIKGKSKDHVHKPLFQGNVRYYLYSKFKVFRTLEFFIVFLCLLRTKADVYYQRTTSAHTGAVAVFCKLFRKKMIFAVAHDNDLIRFYNSRNFNPDHYNSKIKALIRKTDLYLIDLLIHTGLSLSDVIICQTKDQLERTGDKLVKKSIVIRNSFSYPVPAQFSKENVILWVSNLKKIKRPELFVRLAQEVRIENWNYCIIGEIRDHQYGYIRQKNDGLFYAGSLSYQETLKWFEKAKILVNTSESEGFTNTFIQAWLFRVYVMSLSVNPDKLLTKYEYGFYANNDFEFLKTSLMKVCRNYESFLPAISNASQFAKNEFDLNRNMSILEKSLS